MTMHDPYEQYMQQAEALFEAGDVVKAGQIWQAVLKRDPGHVAARAGLYKVKAHFDTRATQDGLAKAAATPAVEQTNRKTLTPAPPELNSLLEAGCALYDAGLLAKAIFTWEMALQKDPANALAKGYIDGARRKLEADSAPVVPPEAPAEPPPSSGVTLQQDEIEKSLRDGCTLFDMGQMQDALGKWERILEADPDHALANAYANDARKELGLPSLARGERPPAARTSAPEPEPAAAERGFEAARADQISREGVQIYDLGMVDEAIEKWQQALQLEPGHGDATGYLEMARRDREALPPPRPPQRVQPPAPREVPAKPAPPEPGSLEARLQAAENLLRNQKFEEAAFAFQILLDKGASDARVLHGYQQARAFLSAREDTPISLPAKLPAPPAPVGPPRALTLRPQARRGLKLPVLPVRMLLHLPAWFKKPRNAALTAGSVLALALALIAVRSHQRDLALREAVAAAKANAMAPIARKAQVVALAETPQAILQEGEAVLNDDPLTAYYRAKEGLRLDPVDAGSAQLLEKARARMAATTPEAPGTDPDASLKAGDLESARKALGDQLRGNPDDEDLKAKARTVFLALVQSQAMNEHFAQARELLLRGRAMFPLDKTWAARLKLLENLQTKGKAERLTWIPLLG